jgi:hypothetical protein
MHTCKDQIWRQYELTQGKAHVVVWLDTVLTIGQRVTINEMEGWWKVKKVWNTHIIESTCRNIDAFDIPDMKFLRTYFADFNYST